METPQFVCHNGKLLPATNASVSINNRSFRYGDGCFETIKVLNGKILLEELHMERLFQSLNQLFFNIPRLFTPQLLQEQILKVVQKNKQTSLARVRLTIYRGDGGLYDAEHHRPNYLIQSWPLPAANNELNQNGLRIDFYNLALKVCDQFSHIKSNCFLPYTMAALWVKQQQLNDALVLNHHLRIADATKANVFIVNNNRQVITPPLTEGCINGNMRRYLLQQLPHCEYQVVEQPLTQTDVLNAEEVFLTNAIYGIRWVQQVQQQTYGCTHIQHIYKHTVAKLLGQ